MKTTILALAATMLFSSFTYGQIEPGKVYRVDDILELHKAGKKEQAAEIIPLFRLDPHRSQGRAMVHQGQLWQCVEVAKGRSCVAAVALTITPAELDAAKAILRKTGYLAVPKLRAEAINEEMPYLVEQTEIRGTRLQGMQKQLNDIMLLNSKQSIEFLHSLVGKNDGE